MTHHVDASRLAPVYGGGPDRVKRFGSPVAWARWPSTRCCSPHPGASAPGWRWRSRPWPGWCGPSSRPCTATTRSSTTSSWSTASGTSGVVFVDDIAEVPAGPADHAVGPRLGARGRGRRPSQRRLRRRRRVPARHQGPPRGEGAGRQGLPDRLRRPRGPRGGGRHDGGGARRHPPGRDRWTRSTPSPPSTSRSRCSPRRRSSTATGRRWPRRDRGAVPRAVAAGPQRPLLRHHQPAVRAAARSPRAATPSSSSARPTPPTPGPSSKLARESGAPACSGSTAPTSCPTTSPGTVGVTAGASAPEELVEAVIARLDPRDGVEEVRITDEDEYFPPPRELRDLLAAVDVLATFTLGGSLPDRPSGRRPGAPGQRRPGVAWHRHEHGHELHQHGRLDRRAVGGHRRRDGAEPAPGRRAGARHAAVAGRHHRRLRHRSAHPLPADRHPGRARRRRRRGRGRQPVPRHRQGHQRARPPRDRGRDPQALRARRGAQDDPRPPGLPGRALLPPLRRRPERPREAPRGARADDEWRWPSSSPTSGTRRPSTPTTTRSRSSTSRTASASVFASARLF